MTRLELFLDRHAEAISVPVLVDDTGISRSVIYDIVNGTRNPSPDQAREIADSLANRSRVPVVPNDFWLAQIKLLLPIEVDDGITARVAT